MRKFTSVILSILLGAFAVAVGMGFFLKKANDDRSRLADIAVKAEQASRVAQEGRLKAIQDANQQLDTANAQITQAQTALKTLQQERDLVAEAQTLTPTNARDFRTWKQAINLVQGVSCKFPPGNEIRTNDGNALTLAHTVATVDETDPTAANPWLSLTPYDAERESDMLSRFTTSTPVSYLVNGHLLIGQHGTMTGQPGETFVLRVQKNGQMSHLIWIRDPLKKTDMTTISNVLASLSFEE